LRGVAPIGTLLPLRSVATEVSIRVIGERDQPLARATVVIEGGGLPAQGAHRRDRNRAPHFFRRHGRGNPTLFIRSAANHWDRLISAPRLSSAIIGQRATSVESYRLSGVRDLLGWASGLMGVDPIGGRFTRRG